jgi:murein DD-endopeptidase MepM/ murein hydrolase activator NlpD
MLFSQIRLRYFAFILFFCISFGFGSSYANTKEELAKKIQDNKASLDALEKEIRDYNSKIVNTKEEANTLKEAIGVLESRKKNLNKEIDAASIKINNTQYEILDTKSKIEISENKLDIFKKGISSIVREINYSNKNNSFLINITNDKGISEYIDTINDIKSYKNKLSKSLDEVNTIKISLEINKKEQESKFLILSEQKEELDDKKKLVEQNKKENDKLLKETKSREDIYKKQLADRKKIQKDLEKETLDFESKLKAIVDPALLPKSGTGILSYPVKKVTITQYFGNTSFSTKNPQVYNGSGHNGLDFAVPVGTPLYAAADGVVAGVADSDLACRGSSYGKWTMIKHNNGLTTLYAHMSSFGVSVGQTVVAGQKIGLSGNTGYSTGPHLHFTVFASQGVRVAGPTEYKSKSCGTYMIIPIAPRNAYLNPLSYF